MKGLNKKVSRLLDMAEELLRGREASSRRGEERQARWERILCRWGALFELALARMDAADQERVEQAGEQLLGDRLCGPFATWLRDLSLGHCRLPELSAETMKSLLLAWLHPQADGGIICAACGLEYPRHKSPPLSEWKLLPGKRPLEGPPPWYDLPELFHSCPHCGGSRYGSGMDWPHLIGARRYPWMDQGGHAAPPEELSRDAGG